MTTRYYRLHDTDACSPEDLLREEHQVSRVWVGVMYRRCEECEGSGVVGWDDEDERNCPACRGEGQEQVEEQRGVSVCRSLGDLRRYMEERSPYLGDTVVVVELEGVECEERDMDHEAGAVLVRPTRIVSVRPHGELEL